MNGELEVVCFKCGRSPEELEEYVEMAEELGITPTEYVQWNEGTYNRENGHFCCTECYVKIGMPAAPYPGWKAP